MERLKHILLVPLLLMAFSIQAVEKVVVLGLFSDRAMIEVDGKRYTLAKGQKTPEGVVLIAADSDKALVEVNGVRQSLVLGGHISSTYASAESKSVAIWPGRMGMYQVNGYINGYAVNFLVDTGATSVTMRAADANRMGIDFYRTGKPVAAETASGVVKAYMVRLERVSVGDIQLYDVEAAVLEGDMPSSVLLGMSFLGRLEMQHEGQALILKKKW